jgi:amidase
MEMTPKNRKHTFSNDIISNLDAVGIATLIKSKEISAEEVAAACVARAKAINPSINAIVTDNFEASKGLAKSQTSGFFQGVPTFIKDMTYVEGIPTYFGSKAFAKAKPSRKTDGIAKQIFAQGFVNLGTSSMPEFGFTCTTEFQHDEPTRNPWNLNHSTGGSSGGSAALVAAGVVPLAHTADGGGSTRIPASCCGLVGLKPQRGRLLFSELFRTQIVEIATDGVATRTVRDTAHFYAEAEKYHRNKRLPAIGLVEGPSTRKYKIGYTKHSVKHYKADELTSGVLEDTARLLARLGHEVKEITMPVKDQFHEDFANLWSMSAYAVHKFGGIAIKNEFDKKGLSELTLGLSKRYTKNMLQTPFFVQRLRNSYYDYQRYLKELDVDFLLTPTVSHVAPEIGKLGINQDFEEMFEKVMNWACFTPYANACGCPTISLPVGHDATNDLPIGMMLWSNHGLEKDLLDIAYQLEAAQAWKKIYE